MDREKHLIDGEHLDHAAAGGDRSQRVAFAVAREGQPVGVGVRIAHVDRDKRHLAAGCLHRLLGVGQAGIARFPAEQSAEEAHVGALRGVGGRQRARPVKLNEHRFWQAASQIAGEPADSQGRRAVRARWPPHNWSDHVVKNAGEHARTSGGGNQCPGGVDPSTNRCRRATQEKCEQSVWGRGMPRSPTRLSV